MINNELVEPPCDLCEETPIAEATQEIENTKKAITGYQLKRIHLLKCIVRRDGLEIL